MENKYWALILIGVIILSCVVGFSCYETGYNEGYKIGYNEGYETGYNEGYKIGYNEGYKIGHDKGYNSGYFFGEANTLLKMDDCMKKCQSFFGNIKWNCFKTCV